MVTTIIPVHTTENKITGCPEYTVEINSSTAKCMTTQEYNQYISSPEYIKQQNICLGITIVVITLLIIFVVWLFND